MKIYYIQKKSTVFNFLYNLDTPITKDMSLRSKVLFHLLLPTMYENDMTYQIKVFTLLGLCPTATAASFR